MKKLLINGGGYAEIPLIQAAKELGFYVITTGYAEDGQGHYYSDKYIKADFSNKEEIFDLIKYNNIDYIVPGCNDFSILTASYISEKLKIGVFDSYEVTKVLHHKDLFRDFSIKYNITTPKALTIMSLEDIDRLLLKYPLIVKPIDLSGGKGINKVLNKNDLKKSFLHAQKLSRESKVVVEEFIEGTHHSASLLVQNGKIIFDFFADEYFYINKYLVSGAYSNYNIPEIVKNKLHKDTQKIINQLNLVDGILHIQFIINDHAPYILEVTRRSPGDLYIDLVSLSTNIDYAKQIIKSYCSIPLDIGNIEENLITRHCIMSAKKGKIQDIVYDSAIRDNIINKVVWWRKGDEIKDIMTYKAGIVFLKYNSEEEMYDKTNKIDNLIKIILE